MSDELLNLPPLDASVLEAKPPKDRLFKGGLNMVKTNEGVFVNENTKVFGMKAGDFYRLSPAGQREARNQLMEKNATEFGQRYGMYGLGSITRAINAISAPAFDENFVTGPINAVSKFTNSVGDWIQGKEIDESDAWLISEDTVKRLNPGRYSNAGFQEEDTSADIAGAPVGRLVGAEAAGFIATGGIGSAGGALLRRIPQAVTATNRLRQIAQNSRRIKDVAVAARNGERIGRYGPRVQTVVGAANVLREGLTSTAAATVFMDPLLDKNASNSLDGAVVDFSNTDGVPFLRQAAEGEQGIELLGRVDEDDNYLEAWRKTVVVDGLLAPFTILGGAGMVKPVRRFLFDQNVPQFMEAIADVELAPYNAAVRSAANAPTTGLGITMDLPNRSAPSVEPAVPTDPLDEFAKARPGDLPSPGRAESIDSYMFGKAANPWDSAIDRTTSAQLQNTQIASQRSRLVEMGLIVESGDGQYALRLDVDTDAPPLERFDVPAEFESGASSPVRPGPFQNELPTETVIGGPDFELTPRVKASTVADRQGLQVQRDGVQDGADVGPYQQQDIEAEVQKIDQEERKLIEKAQRQSGVEQTQIDFDTRPELSTFLAELDELDDVQIRQILRNVDSKEKLAARQFSLNEMQSSVDQVQLQIQEVIGRMQLEDGNKKKLSSTGGKRKLNPLTKQLQELQERLEVFNNEPDGSFLVGDQLDLAMDQQAVREGLPNAEIEMPPFFDMEWDEAAGMYRSTVPSPTPSRSGYASVDAYREALQKFPRDLLRKMNAPQEVSGDGRIAAILKARTGRRVWSAKKEDIINAMIEFAQKQGKFLEPVGEQLELEMQRSLTLNRLRQTVDVDGETIVDLIPPEFPGGRGIDAAQREDFKRRILQAAIDNGEVQPDITLIPELPKTEFNQTTFIDTLFTDENGQLPLLYATDQLPTYKAGGKSPEALIEEMRSRYDWAELDNVMQSASRRDYWTNKIYDQLTPEQERQMAILDDNFWNPPVVEYVEPEVVTPAGFNVPAKGDTPSVPGPLQVAIPSEVVTPLTPTGASYYAMPIPGGGDLRDIPRGIRKTFRWKAQGLVPEAVAEKVDAVKAVTKPKPKRGKKTKTNPPTTAKEALDQAPISKSDKDLLDNIEAERKRLIARQERNAKLANEASC